MREDDLIRSHQSVVQTHTSAVEPKKSKRNSSGEDKVQPSEEIILLVDSSSLIAIWRVKAICPRIFPLLSTIKWNPKEEATCKHANWILPFPLLTHQSPMIQKEL